MRIVYLKSARRDLAWLRHYYEQVFPPGATAAQQRFRACEALLLGNPTLDAPSGPKGCGD